MRLSTLRSIFPKSSKTGLIGGIISIGNSFCELEGFSLGARDVVRDCLTYDNQEVIYEIQQLKVQLGLAFRYKKYQKVRWFKSRIQELERNIEICWLKGSKFPTGHLELVKNALVEAGINFELKDQRKNNAPFVEYAWMREPLPPRYFQEEMLNLGLEKHRGVFESAVGSGKTYVMQLLTYHLQVPTLIILPSKDLSIQTFDSFNNAFGADDVALIDSAKKAKAKEAIKIVTVHTLMSMEKAGTLAAFLGDIGLVCIDEVHHAGAHSYTNLLPYFDHIYYRFGFSGTFMRNDSKTLDMWGFLSTVLYRYSAGQATREGFLTPLKVLVHEIPGIKSPTYQREYSVNYCENEDLLLAIKDILDEINETEQVLILIGRKEKSGEIIHKYLDELGISNRYVSGDSKRDDVRNALQEFNSKGFRVLVGSTIIGEGIDVRSTDHLIMAQGGKSEIAITQAVGRAVRLFPGKKIAYLHDFRFLGTKYLEKHLQKRLDIYEKNFDGEVQCLE